jgi:transcriptional regulator with XRE-family HTH domain
MMPIDKYSQLKIASNVLGFSLGDFAEDQGVSMQAIREVCKDNITSARLSKAVDQKIAEAECKFDEFRQAKRDQEVPQAN